MINVKEVRSSVNVNGKVKGNVKVSFRMKWDVPWTSTLIFKECIVWKNIWPNDDRNARTSFTFWSFWKLLLFMLMEWKIFSETSISATPLCKISLVGLLKIFSYLSSKASTSLSLSLAYALRETMVVECRYKIQNVLTLHFKGT